MMELVLAALLFKYDVKAIADVLLAKSTVQDTLVQPLPPLPVLAVGLRVTEEQLVTLLAVNKTTTGVMPLNGAETVKDCVAAVE
jgi:hypothetical protein